MLYQGLSFLKQERSKIQSQHFVFWKDSNKHIKVQLNFVSNIKKSLKLYIIVWEFILYISPSTQLQFNSPSITFLADELNNEKEKRIFKGEFILYYWK